MALDFASPQRPDSLFAPSQCAADTPKLFRSFFQSTPPKQPPHNHSKSPLDSSPSFLPDSIPLRNNSSKPSRRLLRSKPSSSSIFPAPNLSNSPTSLAADLSQNFHIDKTPTITSRRTIFSLQKEVPSFELDLSPLPHKPSYFDLRKEEDVDMESDSTSSTSMFSDAEEDDYYDEDATPKFKLSNTQLTSLYSSSNLDSYFAIPVESLPTKQQVTNPMKSLSNTSLFRSKPPQLTPDITETVTRRPPAKTSPPSWGMPSFGQPSNSHGFSTPVFPRHCKVRRTQSMFEHPEDVIAPDAKQASELSSPADACQSILAKEDCPIKSFTVEQDPFRRIDPTTLCDILDGHHENLYDRHVIVDCRFEYEFQGGHINGAININSKERLEEVLIANSFTKDRVLLVFHCEYSAHRGPRMAMQLRNLDRQVNMNRYPMLHYPDIAILHGGYSRFFEQHTTRCFPQRYVGMNDHSHADACEREMDRFRRTMRVSRTQSYTYGTVSPVVATKSLSLNYSSTSTSSFICSPVNRSQTLFSSFKFPLKEQQHYDSDMNYDSSPSLCISSSNDTTPTQAAANRRRLGVPKLAQSKLFS